MSKAFELKLKKLEFTQQTLKPVEHCVSDLLSLEQIRRQRVYLDQKYCEDINRFSFSLQQS